MNLSTGAPLIFEVAKKDLDHLERQKKLVASGQAPMLGTIEALEESYEFSFFPSYQEVLKIFFANGYTTELITQILTEFGVPEPFIAKLIDDETFIHNVKPWFEGITCDGERASRTLKVVYDLTKRYFSATEKVEKMLFP